MNQIYFIHSGISVFTSSFGHNDLVSFQLSSIVVNILLYYCTYRSQDLHYVHVCAIFFTFTTALFHCSTAQLPSSASTRTHCTMLSCPNPSCIRNLKRTNKPFPSEKSFSHHLQQFPMCKAFLMEQSSIMSSNRVCKCLQSKRQ